MYLDSHYRHLWWTILTAFTSIHKRSGNNDSHCLQSAARHSERSGIACLSPHGDRQAMACAWPRSLRLHCAALRAAHVRLQRPAVRLGQSAVSGCTPRSACSVSLYASVSLQCQAVHLGQSALSGCSPRSGCIVRLFTSVRLQHPAVRPGYYTRLWAVIRKKDKDINRPAGYASYLQTGVTLDIAQVTP